MNPPQSASHGRHVLVGILAIHFAILAIPGRVGAATISLSWLTQYGNESIETADLPSSPFMLANISNSRMTSAPSYLQGALYLERRSQYTTNFQSLEGIAEQSEEWLRPDRVSVSGPAVVLAAVPTDLYPQAAAILIGDGWKEMPDTIQLAYVGDTANLQLFAGLVNAGPVSLSGSQINPPSISDDLTYSDYFFFQDKSAFSAQTLASFQTVTVPEPSSSFLWLTSLPILIGVAIRRRTAGSKHAALAG